METKMRETHSILRNQALNVLMVSANGGGNFGDITLKYLREIREGNGFMIACCTKHHAEVTPSPFSSFEELKFAINNKVKIIPLKLDDVYPPEPH